MFTCSKKILGIVAIVVFCVGAACSVRVGQTAGGGGFIEFTIANKTFALVLGDNGVFAVVADAAAVKKGVLVENLFGGETPEDRPQTARVTLLPSSVRVTPLNVGKAVAPLQAIAGTFNVVVRIADASSSDPCTDGTNLETFQVVASANGVTLSPDTLDLPADVLTNVITGAFTLCLEVSGDADATVVIDGMDFVFGDAVETTTVTFTFRNDDIENIHFLLPGETFDASNRVTPGGTGTGTGRNVQIGDTITVQAGRNGIVLASTDCPTVTSEDYTATVVWDGLTLTCDAQQSGGSTVQVPIDANGDATPVTDTVNGVDYAMLGVMSVASPETPPAMNAPPPSSVTVDLADLGLQYVETVYLATQSAHAWDIPNGVKVATFICEYAEGGTSTTLEMVMGSTTAEWGYENPTQFESMGGPVSHAQPPIVTSILTTVDSDEPYYGHSFAASVRLDTGRTLVSMRLELEDAQEVAYTRTPENIDFLLLVQAHMGITLEGPAGQPASGGGGDFAITAVDWPTSVESDGNRGDLTVTWSGDPVFPVQIVYQLAGTCPPNVNCTTPTMTFDDGANPLLFPEAVWCSGVTGTVEFAYEVVMIDARGIESDPFPAAFTCGGAGSGGAGSVTSTFDSGDDGWWGYADAQSGPATPNWFGSGGNPGGYVSADDDVVGGLDWFWRAPDKFHGDFSGAYGKTLTFDLVQSGQGMQFDDDDDVILVGGGISLDYNLASNPGMTWTPYSVPLSETGWTSAGMAATQQVMMTVLSSLTDLLIRGEYINGPDTGGLDNVTLNAD